MLTDVLWLWPGLQAGFFQKTYPDPMQARFLYGRYDDIAGIRMCLSIGDRLSQRGCPEMKNKHISLESVDNGRFESDQFWGLPCGSRHTKLRSHNGGYDSRCNLCDLCKSKGRWTIKAPIKWLK